MKSIEEVRQFCQDQADFHYKQAKRPPNGKPERLVKHEKLAERFASATALLSSLPASGIEPAQGDLFKIDPYDVSDLPAELVSQLTIPKSDDDEVRMVQLLRIAGRPLSINEIMVGLYRKFGDFSKRSTVNARLYRLANKGDLVTTEKGVYALPEHSQGDDPTEPEGAS